MMYSRTKRWATLRLSTPAKIILSLVTAFSAFGRPAPLVALNQTNPPYSPVNLVPDLSYQIQMRPVPF